MGSTRSASTERTPAGRLQEARLQSVLGYQLVQASIVANALFERAIGTPHGLRPIEYTVLTLIAENPGGSLARLARALAVKAPHITTVVDRLESRGLIERAQSEQDRRSQVLHTSALGADVVRRATEAVIAAEREAVGLSPGEHAMLLELLHKVACARGER